ncbi:MAG: hypothetical protein K1X75_13460 [Leptospirales bacterium]|nr:hypothetical protein [Leptospirales bacterium]
MTPSPTAQSPIARDPFSGAQIRIGVMGSAGGEFEDEVRHRCRALGRSIAKHGCCLLTGACPGLPHETALGAHSVGGRILGISPAKHLREHVERYHSPYREYDTLIYTGLGSMGRELINIRSSDIVLIVSGRSGTLGEFAIAFEEGKLIGVLPDSGGIADILPEIEQRLMKDTGAQVVYDADPAMLVERVLQRYLANGYTHPQNPRDSG